MFFQENGQYRCAAYLRLSRSDGDQQESNSIKNQRALLNDYLGKHPRKHRGIPRQHKKDTDRIPGYTD
mgnify:CR=1 FL=1